MEKLTVSVDEFSEMEPEFYFANNVRNIIVKDDRVEGDFYFDNSFLGRQFFQKGNSWNMIGNLKIDGGGFYNLVHCIMDTDKKNSVITEMKL